MRAALFFTAGATGHGIMDYPPTRNRFNGEAASGAPGGGAAGNSCAGGACLWFSQGCTIGCPTCDGSYPGPATGQPPKSVCGGYHRPTVPQTSSLRTYAAADKSVANYDWTQYNPWRAPGSAPVMDPCGVAGGAPTTGKPGNGGVPPPGAKQGDKGTGLKAGGFKPPVWTAGDTVEVSWSVDANHGGGYQYRLCPKNNKAGITEKCFQRTPLKFAKKHQKYRFTNGTDVSFVGTFTSTGTTPAGSMWAKNPIPACGDTTQGGSLHSACTKPNFHAPVGAQTWGPGAYGLWGFGGGRCGAGLPGTYCTVKEQAQARFLFSIGDEVEIPADLTPGDYVIGFRWDSEQTVQVWQSCADVVIQASGTSDPYARPVDTCESCYDAATCMPCYDCLSSTTGDCAHCYAKGPQGTACLSNDGSPDCKGCWNFPGSKVPPPGPAPPAPAATKYGCYNSECTADPTGVPLATCQKVCHGLQ